MAKKTKKRSRSKASVDPNLPLPKADPDAEVTPTQLRTLQAKLVEERDLRIAALKRHVADATEDTGSGGDEADVANAHATQAYLLRVADKEQKLLRQIQHALQKLETGEYGVCEGSGEPISYKRLLLRPWTRYSVRHKEELERNKAQRRHR